MEVSMLSKFLLVLATCSISAIGQIGPVSSGSGSGSGGLRVLIPGVTTSCSSSLAVAVLPPSNGPTPLCEADNITGYIQFTNAGQVFYQRIDLPSDWAGTLKLTVAGWSATTSAATVGVQTGCVGTGAVTTGITFNAIQNFTFTPNGSSFRTRLASQVLTTTGCSAGSELQIKYTITAVGAQLLNIRTLQVTE